MSNGWTPNSKALPETSGDYLVTCKGGAVRIEFYYRPGEFQVMKGWENSYGYEAIAWQPLPEAYKEEKR